MKKYLIYNEQGMPCFLINVTELTEHHISGEVDEVDGLCEDNTFEVQEKYLGFLIKWDGCSHINFGNDGYLHICGWEFYKSHMLLMSSLMDLASNQVEAWDDKIAGYSRSPKEGDEK